MSKRSNKNVFNLSYCGANFACLRRAHLNTCTRDNRCDFLLLTRIKIDSPLLSFHCYLLSAAVWEMPVHIIPLTVCAEMLCIKGSWGLCWTKTLWTLADDAWKKVSLSPNCVGGSIHMPYEDLDRLLCNTCTSTEHDHHWAQPGWRHQAEDPAFRKWKAGQICNIHLIGFIFFDNMWYIGVSE